MPDDDTKPVGAGPLVLPPQVSANPSLTARGRAMLGDRLLLAASRTAALLVLAILALIFIATLTQAWPAVSYAGLDLVTSSEWNPVDLDGDGPGGPHYGALAFIYGTAYVSLIALVLAVPVSIGIALYLTEYAPRRVRAPIITTIDLLAALPSVVLGLWALLVLAPWLQPGYRGAHDLLGGIPLLGRLFGPAQSGKSFLTAGIIVAVMIVPIITSITREVFATVPAADKQAALALGATRWEMIRGAVLPHSFGGVVGAVILGLGRAMGETIAVTLLVGASTQLSVNLFASGNTLAAVIAQNWGDPGVPPGRSALVALGVILFVMTITVNSVARVIVRRVQTRMRGLAS